MGAQNQSKANTEFVEKLSSRAIRTAIAALAAGCSVMSWAQSTSGENQKLERVEITGSSIKRVDAESALPVQVVKKSDIEKMGVSTAAELLANISANAASLTDGASITDNTGGQRGFNSANLRGIGTSSTLILLNGRRLANFASPGDNAGVDLNNIPAGAIERVEILKDGASAIYGTDAIGGVINFITRKDYRGVDIAASIGATEEGGAGKRTFTLSGGLGELDRDGFNLFGTVDIQQLDSLRSTQRDWLMARPLAETVPYYLSSRPFPGNVRLSGTAATRTAQLAAINDAGYRFNGTNFNQRTVNLFAPTCNPPASVYTTLVGTQACGYDYMADTEIYPDSQKYSFIGRATMRVNSATTAFVELLAAKTETLYVLSPVPTTVGSVPWTALNNFLPRPVTHPAGVEVRMRATEAGNRSNEVTSDALRVVAGLEGTLANNWDYNIGAAHASNKVADRYVNGYFLFSEFASALRTGRINPFGPSSSAGQELIRSLRINDVARRSEGTTTSVDGKLTGTLGQLAGGAVGVAIGAEFRRETQDFTPSALLLSNNIAGDRDSSGTSPPIKATSNARNIVGAYAEVNAPFTKQLEVQGAIRFDHYEGVGSTVNPKLGVRWQPSREWVVRGSAGTGFRAPSFSELYRPTVFGTSPAFLYDSVYDSYEQYPTVKLANPDLKPEKSRQFSLGAVFEPTRSVNISIDYWNIRKTDLISDLYEKTILENPTRYAAYITRESDGFPTILLKKENQGGLKTSGVDLEAAWRGEATALGRFGISWSGTYVIDYKRQFGKLEPFVSNAGRFLNDKAVQRWRHRATLDWSRGPWALSLSNTYYSGHTDDSYLPDTEPRKVSEYSLWDLAGSWNPNKKFTLRAGVKNLFDTEPPFSNQSYYFLSTYDPTYTDPRGRYFYASVSYSFK